MQSKLVGLVLLLLSLLVLGGAVFAQGPEVVARAAYSQNGVLIGLADLAPLKECSIQSMEGRVKDLKVTDVVRFDLKDEKSEDKQRMTFQFPIIRLASAERAIFQKDFLHKNLKLRAMGYACGSKDDPLEAISIDRAY